MNDNEIMKNEIQTMNDRLADNVRLILTLHRNLDSKDQIIELLQEELTASQKDVLRLTKLVLDLGGCL